MKNLKLAFFVSTLFLLGASMAPAQTQVTVFEMNNSRGQYNEWFIVKLTVDGNTGGTYRGSSLTSVLEGAEVYWRFPVPTNNGEVMVTANAIPGYQFGDPFFVPYDSAGAFCSLIINPATQLNVFLEADNDASGPTCSMH